MQLRPGEPDFNVPGHWPRPPGTRRSPGRWQGSLSDLRLMLTALQDAEFVFWHSGTPPRGGLRWFAPGVPMRRVDAERRYACPARSALAALNAGLIVSTHRPDTQEAQNRTRR